MGEPVRHELMWSGEPTVEELIDYAKVILGREGELVLADDLVQHIPKDRRQEFWRHMIDLTRKRLEETGE